eukprot:Tbor_TRINITY_DN4449_c0_g1::TRINITY_DN4449_c0_g1_i1::g.7969::m.7969
MNLELPSYQYLGERLEITTSILSEDICAKLCKALQSEAGKAVKIVDLCQNNLRPNLSEKIGIALEGTPTVEQILMRYNNIGQLGCDALASVINVAPNLRIIDVRGNNLNVDHARKMLKAVGTSSTITQLGIGDNNLGAPGAALLSSVLEKNTVLTFLDLRQNDFTIEGAKHLASFLEKSGCVLKQLSVFGNRLGPSGMIELSEGLKRNNSLENVCLGNNMMTDTACKALSDALQKNLTIKVLDISSNGITSKGFSILAPAFSRLKSLTLSSNPLGKASADIIVQTFLGNEVLKRLDLWNCALEDHGAVRLSGLIATTTSIVEMNLTDNKIQDNGASAIAKAIAHPSKTIRVIDLISNNIGNKGAAELIIAAEINQDIHSITLNGNMELDRILQRKLEGLFMARRQQREDSQLIAK